MNKNILIIALVAALLAGGLFLAKSLPSSTDKANLDTTTTKQEEQTGLGDSATEQEEQSPENEATSPKTSDEVINTELTKIDNDLNETDAEDFGADKLSDL